MLITALQEAQQYRLSCIDERKRTSRQVRHQPFHLTTTCPLLTGEERFEFCNGRLEHYENSGYVPWPRFEEEKVGSS